MVPSTFSRLKAARCLPVVLAALIFAGCGTHTPDQSTAYMQGTAQADSAFYLQQMQQSSDDTRINWQLLAIRALVKEGKTGQAVELFNQLPQELNDAQRREKTLLAVVYGQIPATSFRPTFCCPARSWSLTGRDGNSCSKPPCPR